MAEKENKVNPGGADEKPKDEKNLTDDVSGTPADPAAVKGGEELKPVGADKTTPGELSAKDGGGLKITGITYIKGEAADKADGVSLPPPGDVRVSSKVVDGLFDDKKKAAQQAEKPAAEVGGAAGGEQTAEKKRGGRPKAEKDENPGTPPKGGKDEKEKTGEKVKKTRAARPPDGSKRGKSANIGGASGLGAGGGKNPPATKTPKTPEPPLAQDVPAPPRDAVRSGETETIVYIDHAELFPFKNHPFEVRDDTAMKNLAESVKERGVDQPALVRPREGGGYELVAGHRRQQASIMAGIKNLPCIVRNMTDEEAVLAMAETNFNQRTEILASERAKALKMQLDAIKRQGARNGVAKGDIGKRSVEIVAERNGMNYKNVQRYVALNNVVPELMKFVDEGKVKFIPAFEMSYIKPKNQQYIAMSIEGEAPVPSGDQAKRMRELDQKGMLNIDTIDGIMLEEKKKGDIQVILNSQELGKYFNLADKSPTEMKEVILKALDEYKEKQPLEFGKPEKKAEQEL